MCSEASDAFSIGGGRSVPDRMEDSAQRTGHTWLRGGPHKSESEATGDTAIFLQLATMPSIQTCLVRMDSIVVVSYNM